VSAKNRPDKTGQKKPEVPFDRYYTPRWAVEQTMREILPTLMLPDNAKILDAGCGRGIWSQVLREFMPKAWIMGIDNDESLEKHAYMDEQVTGDFLVPGAPLVASGNFFDLVMGNPPYSYALPFILKSMQIGHRVMFLVRQGFMSSQARCQFFRARTPNAVWILSHRPAFSNPVYATKPTDTDQTDYCVMVWDKKSLISAPPTLLRWMPEVPREQRR